MIAPVPLSQGPALRRYFRLAHRPFGWNGGIFAEVAGPDGAATLVMNPEAHDRAVKAAGRHLKRLAHAPVVQSSVVLAPVADAHDADRSR